MNVMSMLLKDHEQLREQLDQLEAALRLGPTGSALVRNRCGQLLKLLHSHHRREGCVAESCRAVLTDADMILLDSTHQGGLADLLGIYQGLRAPGSNWPWMQDVLSEWILQMRRHMDQEEHDVFPDFQRVLSKRAGLSEEVVADAPFRVPDLRDADAFA